MTSEVEAITKDLREAFAAADVIIAADPDQGTRAVLFGRETLEGNG
jgi:hypothetical protein